MEYLARDLFDQNFCSLNLSLTKTILPQTSQTIQPYNVSKHNSLKPSLFIEIFHSIIDITLLKISTNFIENLNEILKLFGETIST